jgi:hypothetical protein
MMQTGQTHWSVGCKLIAWEMNTQIHSGIGGQLPYRMVFGQDPRAGISGLAVDTDLLSSLRTEAEIVSILNLRRDVPLEEQMLGGETAISSLHAELVGEEGGDVDDEGQGEGGGDVDGEGDERGEEDGEGDEGGEEDGEGDEGGEEDGEGDERGDEDEDDNAAAKGGDEEVVAEVSCFCIFSYAQSITLFCSSIDQHFNANQPPFFNRKQHELFLVERRRCWQRIYLSFHGVQKILQCVQTFVVCG